MSAVWALDLAFTDKFVLLALADNANDDGACWPSHTTVEAKTSLSNRAVRYAIQRLKAAGFIRLTERYGRSNMMTVTPARDATRHEMPPAPDATPPRHDVPPPLAPHATTPAPDATITIKEPSIEPSVESSRKRAAVASRLPEDFGLTESRRDYAKTKAVDPEAAMEDFRDYWMSCNTANAVKRDWDAAWRMWCRRQVTFKAKDNGQRAPKKTRFAELTEKLEASINGN